MRIANIEIRLVELPVARPHAIGIGVHRAVSMRDDVEEMLVIRGTQPIVVEARWPRHAAVHDHSIAAAGTIMAGRTEDVEPIAPPRQ